MASNPFQFPDPFLPPPFAAGNDHPWSWLPLPTGQEEFEAPPFKKPRFSYETPPFPPQNHFPIPTIPLPPPNSLSNPPQIHKNSMFFKTRLCTKFTLGSCPRQNNCTFAHGAEELRKAPLNWQQIIAEGNHREVNELQKRNHQQICIKFFKEQCCPYGDKCTFLHVEQDISTTMRTSGATEPMPVWNGSRESNGFSSSGRDGNGTIPMTSNWKTKLCHKWGITGHCRYGEKCQYAHGTTELKKIGGHMESGRVDVGAAPSKPLPDPANNASSPIKTQPTCKQEDQQKNGFRKWKGPHQISRIYADWIDDVQ